MGAGVGALSARSGPAAMVGTAVACAAAVMVVAVVGLARGAIGASVELGGIDV